MNQRFVAFLQVADCQSHFPTTDVDVDGQVPLSITASGATRPATEAEEEGEEEGKDLHDSNLWCTC